MRIIRSSREIDEVFQGGARVDHPVAVAIIRETEKGRGPGGRVAFVAGKRLGGAVRRNRSKRVLREAVRRAGGPWPGYDIVLIARAKTASATRKEADGAVKAVVDAMGRGP